MYSLTNFFSSYNQIKIALEDQEKTSFTCVWGTFCWNVIPFGLNNVGATYQHEVMIIFYDMMYKMMEDYVDDTLVKRMQQNIHLKDLGPIPNCMEKLSLRLNPKKYAFGLTSEKLLCYIVSIKGAKMDPENVQAIMEMPPP